MTRNPSYPPDQRWDNCKHDWHHVFDSCSETEVICAKCGCPGDAEAFNKIGDVYWPAT